uniref:Sulfotransferase domain-containing protein n=1 Tax=Pseudo-nitzschia australis TaxID=44445 RepID=A0A7S4EIA0_9STRA
MNHREKNLSPIHRSPAGAISSKTVSDSPVPSLETKTSRFDSFFVRYNHLYRKARMNVNIYHQQQLRYFYYCRCACLSAGFCAFWLVVLLESGVDVTVNSHNQISARHTRPKYYRRHDFYNTNSTAIKSIGQRIVESSYRNSGFADLVADFCPQSKSSSSIMEASTIQNYFMSKCLIPAKLSGNTPGTKHHERWPWWFRTLLRDSVHRKNGLAGSWHMLQFKDVDSASGSGGGATSPSSSSSSSLLLEKGPGLQLCVYEKGGTKHWKQLQCEHNHDYFRNDSNSKNSSSSRPDFNHCWETQPPYDGPLDNGRSKSDRVVFLRDPLDRFLSGFLDKCVNRKDAVDHCEPVSVFSPQKEEKTTTENATPQSALSQESPIDTMLWDRRITFEAYVDTFPLTWNMHFLPQSFYCGGLYRSIDHYDFVGSMGEDFYRDLWELQERYPGLEPGMRSIFKLHQKLDSPNFGKGNSNTKSGSNVKGIETGAAGKVLDYYTPHTVRRVMEYYAMDYVALDLPIPEWAEKMLLQSE